MPDNVLLRPINYPASHEIAYRTAIYVLINTIQSQLNEEIARADAKSRREYEAAITVVFAAWLTKSDLGEGLSKLFVNSLAKYHLRMFLTGIKVAAKVNVEPLISETVFNIAMKKSISDNVELIKSIPKKLLDELKTAVSDAFYGVEFDKNQLEKTLLQRFNVSKSRAKLIARDQTNKTISAMTQNRNRQLGIEEYVWRGKMDHRERITHVQMEGQIVRYDTPPPIGHAGTPIRCRCLQQTVLPKSLMLKWNNMVRIPQ